MKTKGALSFRVQCEDCGGRCRVYNTTEDGTRYFRCNDCGGKFKIIVNQPRRRPGVAFGMGVNAR